MVQIMGILTVVATALASVKIYGLATGARRSVPAWLLMTFVLSVYTLSYWSLMGMETGLAALFLAIGTYAALAKSDRLSPLNHSLLFIVAGIGLYGTRPDAVIYFGVLAIYYLGTNENRKSLMIIGSAVLFVAVTIIAHLVFRIHYYGALIPNTALLKLYEFPLSFRMTNGLSFVIPFLKTASLLIILSVFSLVKQPSAHKYLLMILVLVSLVYQIYVGGDAWPYWRIMTPTMPFLIILSIDGINQLASLAFKKGLKPQSLTLVVIPIMILGIFLYNKPFLGEQFLTIRPYAVEHNINNVRVAYAIKELTTESASVGLFWAGSIPYYSERYTIDFLGKSDPAIAGLKPDLSGIVSWYGMQSVPGHNKYNLHYSIVEKQPTYIQGTRWGHHDVTEWVADRYVYAQHMGVVLLLDENSPDVLWHKLLPSE
jgi:arabinofuranosyltransferase